MDYESQRLPLIETVQLFGFSHHAAECAINAIKARDYKIAEMIGAPMKINGVGSARLCTDLNTMMMVLQETITLQLEVITYVQRKMKTIIMDLDIRQMVVLH